MRERVGQAGTVLTMAWRAAPAAMVVRAGSAVIGGALPVLAAWLLKLVLDGILPASRAPGSDHPGLGALALALALVTATQAALPALNRYLTGEIERAAAVRAVDRLFSAVNRYRGLARFEDPTFADQLRMAQQGARSGPGRVFEHGLALAQGGVTLTGFLATLVLLSPIMAVAVVVAAVPGGFAELALSRRRAAVLTGLSHAERREHFYASLLSSLDAAKEVRLFGLGRFFHQRMLVELGGINEARRRLDRREATVQALLTAGGATVAGAGLWWAIAAATAGRLTAGDVAVFLAAFAGVASTLAVMIHEVAAAYHALLLFEHFVRVDERPCELAVPPQPVAVPRLCHGIEFDDVWFRYGPDRPWTLSGLTLTIAAGRSTALIGRNGAGKSTLVKLLCRFYDPVRGAIRWDGVDLRELDPAELRNRMAVVFQDYMEYDLSAAENIAVGDLAALGDPPALVAAARRAGIHDALERLPRGYDTLLSRLYYEGDDPAAGVLLSGGQWQRVALARAFLRDRRDLLILDEPSSGLDAEAEHEIHRGLTDYRRGRTAVLVSHRLGTIRDADTIVVLADGAVAEQGRHQDLIALGGTYARLFTLQAHGYEPGPEPADVGRRGG